MNLPKTLLLAGSLLAGSAMSAETVDFDDAKPGALPANWLGTKTGSGSPKWSVEKDDSVPSKPNVLKQSGQATYPVCLKTDTKLQDGFVQFDGVDVKVQGGVWHTLRVDFNGPNFVVSLDGKKVQTAKDATFKDAGMVGVWTKADSVTAFDDFRYGEK